MKNHDTYTAATLRSAIYLSAGLIALGLAIGPGGLVFAAVILLGAAYWAHGNARIARAAAEDAAAAEASARRESE